MARKLRRSTRVEPCHHVWLYYQRKVDARRKAKLPCSQLENLMWDYSMHAAFPLGIVQGAPEHWHRLGSKDASNLSSAPTRPTLEWINENTCVDPIR